MKKQIDFSVIIPNRNSPFLTRTIKDILEKAVLKTEVVISVDEDWPDELVDDPMVHYIHPPKPRGMRWGINNAVRLAQGKYVMKLDDHCMVDQGFDKVLVEGFESDEKIKVQIPRRYALDAENWKREERTDNKYPIDYMYIDFPRKGKDHDDGMHGVPWRERREENKDIKIDDTPSLQGSCWVMPKDYFEEIGEMSETGYGQFSQEAQEIGFKTWLGGYRMVVNKNTWYAHLHKGSRYGKFYKIAEWNRYTKEASEWSADHWLNNREPNMVNTFAWFIDEKFPGMPGWPEDWKDQIKEMGWIK